MIAVLRVGMERISKSWSQAPMCVASDGTWVAPTDPDVVKWDAFGALCSGHPDDIVQALELLDGCTPTPTYLLWAESEGRTAAEIVSVFAKAIARAGRMN